MFLPVSIDTHFQLNKIDPEFRPVFRAALPFLETRKNKIHTYIAYQYARALLAHEEGRPEIAIPACILHDVGWSAIPEIDQLGAFGPVVKDEGLKRKHETEGVTIAKDILSALSYQPLLLVSIGDIIDGHDTTQEAKSPEDAIVKDADKLWRYSEIGFLTDFQRFNSTPVDYYGYLMDNVGHWFLTATGQKIALDEARARKVELDRHQLAVGGFDNEAHR